jgi:hypothetical protein
MLVWGIVWAAGPEAIRYTLREPGRVSLALYDQDGIQVRTLRKAEPQAAGKHAIVWDGLDQKVSATKKDWPLPEIAAGPFSAVWEGFIQPRFTEPGRLFVSVDCGLQDPKLPPPQRVRFWVNGKLELDYWAARAWDQVHLPTRWFAWQASERVAIKLEYSCNRPSDELGLCWEGPSVPVQHIPAACLYPRKD